MRVFFNSLRCFFLAIRLRRFLMTEPTKTSSDSAWGAPEVRRDDHDSLAVGRGTTESSAVTPGYPAL